MPPGQDGRNLELHSNAGSTIVKYFQNLNALIPQLPFETISEIVSVFLEAIEEQRTIFIFGNGGSAASASHMMCDMNKGASESSKRPKVMALTDNVSLISAWANDCGYEYVFSEQLKTFLKPRDVVFAVSTSGDSPNILQALETAREYGALTIGLAGCQGGTMKALCDLCAIVPSDNAQAIEDLHQAILHSIFTAVKEGLMAQPARKLARAASF
jgi:D-sedoheptulose 7-phosphate isomerase